MKTKIFSIIGVALFAGALAFNLNTTMSTNSVSDVTLANVEAIAQGNEINPSCPNGCTEGGGGCWCYGSYPHYREARW